MYNIISVIVCKALNSNTLSLLYSTELLSGIREWMEIEMLCVCILQFLGSLFFHLPSLPDIHPRLCRASMVFSFYAFSLVLKSKLAGNNAWQSTEENRLGQ